MKINLDLAGDVLSDVLIQALQQDYKLINAYNSADDPSTVKLLNAYRELLRYYGGAELLRAIDNQEQELHGL